MPYNILRYKRNMRDKFYREYRRAAQSYIPQKVTLPPGSTIFARVNVLKAVQEAARRRVKLLILYKKIADKKDSIEYYKISVLSYKYKKLRVGIRKMLYAWDEEKLPHQMRFKMRNRKKYKDLRFNRGTLKHFVVRNIMNCAMTDENYSRWVDNQPVMIP